MSTTKKTPTQLRWAKRKDKVNKARRAKRKAARAIREAAWPKPTTRPRKARSDDKILFGLDRAAAGNTTVNARMVDGKVMVESVERTPPADNPDTIRAKAWASLGRKKGGIEKVAAEIAEIREYSYGSGRASGEGGKEQAIRASHAMMDERIISAFIARMQIVESSSGIGIPPAVVISGLECAKIIDALRSAGYSAASRQRRSTAADMMGKAHSEVRQAS